VPHFPAGEQTLDDENRPVIVLPDDEAVARQGARRVAAAAGEAISGAGRFTLALAGGRTPRALYRRLREEPLDWARIELLFGDERCVPPDHPDSNYRMVQETLLDGLPVPPARVLRMEGERDPAEAADRYASALRGLFPSAPFPRLDLVLLGMGVDGHTASLFPGTSALEESVRWVVANHVPSQDAWRLTLTLPVLRAAAATMFVITGLDKAAVVSEAFGGRPHPVPYPCERALPSDGALDVLVDRAAAALLPS
jgi:6-phosphogluconolactonase